MRLIEAVDARVRVGPRPGAVRGRIPFSIRALDVVEVIGLRADVAAGDQRIPLVGQPLRILRPGERDQRVALAQRVAGDQVGQAVRVAGHEVDRL